MTYTLTEIELQELFRQQRELCANQKFFDSGIAIGFNGLHIKAIINAPLPPLPKKEDIQPVRAIKQEYCDLCDGVGWYEGGYALKTTCKKCNGTGIIQKKQL